MTVIPPSAQAARLSFTVFEGTALDWCSTTHGHFFPLTADSTGRHQRGTPRRLESCSPTTRRLHGGAIERHGGPSAHQGPPGFVRAQLQRIERLRYRKHWVTDPLGDLPSSSLSAGIGGDLLTTPHLLAGSYPPASQGGIAGHVQLHTHLSVGSYLALSAPGSHLVKIWW
jgi:hypothetical protein